MTYILWCNNISECTIPWTDQVIIKQLLKKPPKKPNNIRLAHRMETARKFSFMFSSISPYAYIQTALLCCINLLESYNLNHKNDANPRPCLWSCTKWKVPFCSTLKTAKHLETVKHVCIKIKDKKKEKKKAAVHSWWRNRVGGIRIELPLYHKRCYCCLNR